MNAQKKEAVALTTARTNELHRESYCKSVLLSSLKVKIGQLLLYLQTSTETGKQDCWQVFESKLRRYVDLKVNEVKL